MMFDIPGYWRPSGGALLFYAHVPRSQMEYRTRYHWHVQDVLFPGREVQ